MRSPVGKHMRLIFRLFFLVSAGWACFAHELHHHADRRRPAIITSPRTSRTIPPRCVSNSPSRSRTFMSWKVIVCLMARFSGNVGKPTPKAISPSTTNRAQISRIIDYKCRETERPRSAQVPDAGYPMAYWCEFKPAYGFHEGFVHPYPHTHGCVRLHGEAAAGFSRCPELAHRCISRHPCPKTPHGPAARCKSSIRAAIPIRPARFMMSVRLVQRSCRGPLLTDG